ncbi:MAG TPA: hypothetical protein VKS21_09730, partial [Spirochaetota bacterium]|nr:hypothetical protein [Spirochaetota bacterium]
MLKLKYNEELKTKFLAFWALDTVAQFNSLTEDPVKYINNFFKLSPDCREIITAIIRKNIKNHGLCIKDRFLKINDPEKLYVKKNTLNAANHDIELLDTYSLITIKKNRSNLDAAADIVCLSKTLLEILKKIPVINTDELLKKNYPVKKKLPRPEKSLLHRIYNSLYFKEHKEPALVHSLAAKKLIKPVITPDYQPALITHHTLKQEPVPLEPAAAYNFRETPAYLMHLLDERLYRLRTNSRKKSGSPAGTVEPDITFIQELAAGIVSARKTSFFSKLPFYKKYYYILKFFFP